MDQTLQISPLLLFLPLIPLSNHFLHTRYERNDFTSSHFKRGHVKVRQKGVAKQVAAHDSRRPLRETLLLSNVRRCRKFVGESSHSNTVRRCRLLFFDVDERITASSSKNVCKFDDSDKIAANSVSYVLLHGSLHLLALVNLIVRTQSTFCTILENEIVCFKCCYVLLN